MTPTPPLPEPVTILAAMQGNYTGEFSVANPVQLPPLTPAPRPVSGTPLTLREEVRQICGALTRSTGTTDDVHDAAEMILSALSRQQGRGDATEGPAGSFGYCDGCYHPLDRCSHCDGTAPQGRGDVGEAPILRQTEYLCPKCGRDILAYHQTQTLYVRQLIAEGKTTCDLTESEALQRLVDTLRPAPSSPETPK